MATPTLLARTRPLLRRRWIMIAAALVIVFVVWFMFFRGTGGGELSYELARADRGNVETSVSSSGSVSALVTVTVGSQISGILQQVLADFNSRVTKGQLLAVIDPSTYQSRVRSAEADLVVQQATVGSQEVQVSNAQVSLDQAKRDYDRAQTLASDGLVSTNDLEKARNTYEQGQNNLKIADANLNNARAQTVKVRANLDQMRIDLSRTEIRSPVDGVVVSRNVDTGQTVAAAMQAPELFKIAQDLSSIQIETKVDEADIGSIREGADATFKVDAYPERTFQGRVVQVRINGQTTSNVVTYSVMVQAENRDRILLPGMTANVRIITNRREDVLRVPNSALRFRPTPTTGGGSGPAATGARGGAPAGAPPGAAARGESRGGGAGGGFIEMTPEVMQQLGLDADQQSAVLAALKGAAERAEAQNQTGRSNPLGGQTSFRRFGGGNDPAAYRQRVENALRSVLSGEQMEKYLAMNSMQTVRPGTVYMLDVTGKPVAYPVRIGLADDAYTEVVEGLKEGDEIIVRARTGQRP